MSPTSTSRRIASARDGTSACFSLHLSTLDMISSSTRISNRSLIGPIAALLQCHRTEIRLYVHHTVCYVHLYGAIEFLSSPYLPASKCLRFAAHCLDELVV